MTILNDDEPHMEMNSEPEVWAHGLDFFPMATLKKPTEATGYKLPGKAKRGEAVNLLLKDGTILYEMFWNEKWGGWAKVGWKTTRGARHTVLEIFHSLEPVGWQPVPRGLKLN